MPRPKSLKSKIQSVKYVDWSDVFAEDEYDLIREIFGGGDHDFTWGDTPFTLITTETLIESIEDMVRECDDIPAELWDGFKRRLKALGKHVYVNLEN